MQKPRNEEFFLLFFTEYILLARVMETIDRIEEKERERRKISCDKNIQ